METVLVLHRLYKTVLIEVKLVWEAHCITQKLGSLRTASFPIIRTIITEIGLLLTSNIALGLAIRVIKRIQFRTKESTFILEGTTLPSLSSILSILYLASFQKPRQTLSLVVNPLEDSLPFYGPTILETGLHRRQESSPSRTQVFF